MRCCFYRENNEIDAMKTSMCFASDFVLLLHGVVVFFSLFSSSFTQFACYRINSLKQRKLFSSWKDALGRQKCALVMFQIDDIEFYAI